MGVLFCCLAGRVRLSTFLLWVLKPRVLAKPVLAFQDLQSHVLGQSLHRVANVRGVDATDRHIRSDLEGAHKEGLLLPRGEHLVALEDLVRIQAEDGPFIEGDAIEDRDLQRVPIQVLYTWVRVCDIP